MDLIIRHGKKVKLCANNKQVTKFKQHAGTARFAFNWGLERMIKAMVAWKDDNTVRIPSAIDLHRQLNALKPTQYPWMYEVSKCAPQEALRDCETALKNYFRRCKTKAKKKKGFPKFKRKFDNKQSFRLTGSIHVLSKAQAAKYNPAYKKKLKAAKKLARKNKVPLESILPSLDNQLGAYIKLPRVGIVKLAEVGYLPIGSYEEATVSYQGGNWHVSVKVNSIKTQLTTGSEAEGIDLGINKLAVCSDGTVYQLPDKLKPKSKLNKRLRRQQRRLSRKVKPKKGHKGKTNYGKQKFKLQRIHNKIKSIRNDALHKATSALITRTKVLVLEDLAVSNMVKNHKLARAISNVGFYEFRRQIAYKSSWYGRNVVIANRFYPSSKLDHKDRSRQVAMPLSDHWFVHVDGSKTDRDLNAAINLRDYYLEPALQSIRGFSTVSSTGINASGEGSSSNLVTSLVSPSMKEEFNVKSNFRFL